MTSVYERKLIREDVAYVYEGVRDPVLDELLKELEDAITTEKK